MKPGKFDPAVLTLGFAFLYIPILILVVYSFNESKLVTVWGGFSLEWYRVMWSMCLKRWGSTSPTSAYSMMSF